MVLVMPAENPRDLDLLSAHLVENADDNRIENIFDTINREVDSDEAYGGEVELIMPEFEVKSDLPIRDMLENVRAKFILSNSRNDSLFIPQLGVEAIFTEGKFDRIIEGLPLTVSDVKHKALLQVDKEGSVGAAATGKTMDPSGPRFPSLDPPNFFFRDNFRCGNEDF